MSFGNVLICFLLFLVPGQLSTPWSVPSGPVQNLLHSGLRSVGGTFSDSDFAGLVPGQLSTPSSVPSRPVSLFSDSTGLHQLDPTTLHARLENNSGGAGTLNRACLTWVSRPMTLLARFYTRKSQLYCLICRTRFVIGGVSDRRRVDGDEVVSLPFQLLHLFSDSTGMPSHCCLHL